jgi:hypothetical protein
MARKLAEVIEPQNFEQQYEELQSLYEFINPDEIRPFVESKQHLVKLLRDAKYKLEKYFPGVRLTLERFPDAKEENGDCQMLVGVYPPDEMKDIQSRIGKFDNNWYFKVSSKIKRGFCFDYNHHSLPTEEERMAMWLPLIGKVEAPEDWSAETDHYRLGTPKLHNNNTN